MDMESGIRGSHSSSFVPPAFADYLLCTVNVQRKALLALRGCAGMEQAGWGSSGETRIRDGQNDLHPA